MPYADRVQETTTVTSTATITLGGATATGFRRVSAAFPVGTTGLRFGVDDDNGNWENGVYTLTSANLLTRTAVLSSSNAGQAVTFPAGTKRVSAILTAADIGDFLKSTDGLTVGDLPRGVPQATDLIPFARAAGGDLAITYGDFLALVNGNPPASDTTAPSFPDALSSSAVTQTSFTLSWQAATDASGIARYEYSYDGSTWTTAGTALSVNLTGRTAGTTYNMRVRAVDPSGNISTVRTLAVTTAAASGDTQAPSMTGSIGTSNISSSGYTFSWTAGTDNVGVDHYETSIDGGSTFQNNGTSLSRLVTGRPASTTDNLRVRAHDAAGNISNVLTGTVTTLAAAPATDYNFTPFSGNGFKTSMAFTSLLGTTPNKYALAGNNANSGYNTVGLYWNVNNPTPTKVYGGWGLSNTSPPSMVELAQNNGTQGRTNGMVPMTKANGDAWTFTAFLWPTAGSGPWYFWAQAEDSSGNLGIPECLNPSGMMVT